MHVPSRCAPFPSDCALCLAPALQPPIVPKLCGEGDTSNFEAYPENDWNTAPPVSPKDLEVFKNF